MGWTFFHKPKGKKAIATIKEQFGEKWCAERVVAESATREAVFLVIKDQVGPDNKVYVPDADGSARTIAVIAIKNAPRSEYNFGYKDMTETMGPYGCECPPSIIAAASPLQDPIGPEPEYSSLRSAREYRKRSLLASKMKAAKRALKVGTKIKLPKPLSFGGIALDEFTVERCRVRGRKGMSTVFRSVETGGLYGLSAMDLVGATEKENA
jgi:hypothetical protein